MTGLKRAVRIVGRITEIFCSVLMIVMCVCTFGQIVYRWALGRSFYWTDEVIVYSMVWVTFMGAAVAVARDSHTRIDFFVSLLPARVRKWVQAFGDVVCAVFMILLCNYSLPIFAMNTNNLSSALKMPLSIVYLSLIVGGALMVILFLLNAWKKVMPEGEEASA